MTMPTSVCRELNPGNCKQQTQQGFTLLEILLVLSIVALAAIIVVPNVGSLDGRGFSAQVRQAHTLLNYARRTAVVNGHPASVAFAMPDESENEQPLQFARDNVGVWQNQGAELRFLDSTEQESDIETVLEVGFFPEGGSTGGTLIFERAQQRAAIHVDPFTGRVELLDEDHEVLR